MTDYKNVKYQVENRVATIALNRPDTLNAFRRELRLDLFAALQQAEADDEVRIIVITGEGRGFSSGADLSEDKSAYVSFVDECEQEYKPFLVGIGNSKKLCIAAVNGVAAGIGAATAMQCDLMIMAEDAYLYQAFSAIGLMPDGGATQLLLHRLGYQRALEMVVDAGRLTAQECLDLGITNKVVATNSLREEAQKWAEHLAAGAPLAQEYAKRMMRKARQMSYADVVDAEASMQANLSRTEDVRNGIGAFLNKTKPTFVGK